MNNKKRVSIVIDKSDYELLKQLSVDDMRSLNNLICNVLHDYLQKEKKLTNSLKT